MKKKILFIVNLDKFFISHRLPIAIAIKNLGFEVHIAAKLTKSASILEENGFITHNLKIDRGSLSIVSNIITFARIFKLIFFIRPNLLHLITIKPLLFGSISSYFFKDISTIISVSGLGYIFSDKGRFSYIRKKVIIQIYKLALMNKRNIIIFQNKDDKKKLMEISNLNKNNLKLIYGSGVNLSKFYPKNYEIDPPIVLFAGRLLISKGINDFIEAAKYLKGIRFVIAGEYDYENPDCVNPEYIKEISGKGIVEYWGYSERMEDIINKCSIVILPSYYGEGLPKILIEAAACGKPIITTDHPGCRDAIIEKKTGLLVPIKDPKAIANAIKDIINNKKRMMTMGKAARFFAEENFSIESVIKNHLKIYEESIK